MDEDAKLRGLYRRWLGAMPPDGGRDALWARILEDLEKQRGEEAGE